MHNLTKAEKTQMRILKAATKEFSTFGIAGARVDRIAEQAKANKSLIYNYFGNKEKLFEAVLKYHLDDVYKSVPFNAYDLPEYAANLFESAMDHPYLMKLVMWNGLEPEHTWPLGEDLSLEKQTIAIHEQQVNGTISSDYKAEFILTVILTMASAWTDANPFGKSILSNPENHRSTLKKLIYSLVKSMI
ncbi:TetR family transcriptional regulator [Vibrio tritonius]|uniref:TetR family transcriptional regulator n=1 Tax=Vibrio tritonius TaxID=1435069 RepID=A0ABS7YKF6_9VIBR|nr:TetR family transcriptional regulator [Vibrio tritonius]MCA2016126.1 TetR family transcriptional regulator [Vibrio tritonius]